MYETTLLQTQARLAPRILMLSEGVRFQTPYRFSLCVVHEPGDEAAAALFKESMLAYYPNGWQYHSMQLVDATYATMAADCNGSEIIYLLNASETEIAAAAAFAVNNQKLSMAYDSHYLSVGVMLSLSVGRAVRPYLNLGAAEKAGIDFDADLKRISRLYLKETKAK